MVRAIVFAFTGWLVGLAPAQDAPVPLPLDVALTLRAHNGRSPIELSPDGHSVLHTIGTADTVPRGAGRYSVTGVPFAEGNARMEVTVTEVATGHATRLGAPDASSWAGAWSPNGDRVAFYSDAGGSAGLWIWHATERVAHRVGDLTVRPLFGFEKPAWSPNGNAVLVKTVPAGKTIAELNALEPVRSTSDAHFSEVAPGQASVIVRTAGPRAAHAKADDPSTPDRRPPIGDVSHARVDLVAVELATGEVTRLAADTPVRTYGYSPDGRAVAWTVLKGPEQNSQQPNYDVVVTDLDEPDPRLLAIDARMAYGNEWSWSPDSKAVAWLDCGQLARTVTPNPGRIVLADVATGSTRRLATDATPCLDPGDGEVPPLWDRTGEKLYGLGNGELWRVDVASGAGTRMAAVDDWQLRALVSRRDATIWTTDDGATAWAIGSSRSAPMSGIHAIALDTGRVREVLREPKVYSTVFNTAACDATGEIAFVATDQQHTHDVWLLDTATLETRQTTHINRRLEEFGLGQARLLRWRTESGQELAGTLLLPPTRAEGQRLPLVVWIYGGSNGSEFLNRFGFWGMPAFNMHVLATRGYAVLFPDAPLGIGTPMRDLMTGVMPGVDAAIEQGYADPERLALMGQSYGSYCTLAMITQTDRFKAAIITAAVLHPDLFADYLDSIGYYEQGQGRMGGSIWEYPERYRENSPLFRFDRITTPLLIGQGEQDGDLTASAAIFNALERLGKPVEYRLYENEGHVITKRPNLLDFWQRRLGFLAEHLDLQADARGYVRAQQ